MELVISPLGQVRCVYDEAIDLAQWADNQLHHAASFSAKLHHSTCCIARFMTPLVALLASLKTCRYHVVVEIVLAPCHLSG